MPNYKLIACDLDGTLVSTDLTISADNKKAISEFKKMGVHFVPCTGRTLSEMQEVVKNPDIRYIIYSNGAAIWDKETDKTTFLGFSKETAAELMDILLSFDCFIIIHYRGETFASQEKGWTCVTYDGIPIGWGKASDGVLKNHFPKYLRF